jgi:Family of unknown function (DUF6912)
VRVYLPTTEALLATRLSAPGAPDGGVAIADAGQLAFAVTPALREWYREGDLEELEYVAMTHAAKASLRLLATRADGSDRPRRVVLAADVADGDARPQPDVDMAAVRLDTAVPLDAIVSAHVDDPGAAPEVAAALAALDSADAGDGDAAFLLDGLDDHELQWYAASELPYGFG